MIEIKDLEVFPDYGSNQNHILWDISPTTQSLENFQIEVQRAYTPTEEFVTIGISPSDIYSYNDSDVFLRDRFKIYWYRLKITDKTTSDVSITSPISYTYVPNPLAIEMVRRENLLLRDYIDNPVVFLIRKTEGQYCTTCYDSVKNRVKFNNCSDCYATGFKGGYYKPIPGYMATIPKTEEIRWTYGIELPQTDLFRWTLNYPLLSPNDIVVDVRSNERFKISRIEATRMQGYLVRQNCLLHQIKVGDIEYTIPTS